MKIRVTVIAEINSQRIERSAEADVPEPYMAISPTPEEDRAHAMELAAAALFHGLQKSDASTFDVQRSAFGVSPDSPHA